MNVFIKVISLKTQQVADGAKDRGFHRPSARKVQQSAVPFCPLESREGQKGRKGQKGLRADTTASAALVGASARVALPHRRYRSRPIPALHGGGSGRCATLG